MSFGWEGEITRLVPLEREQHLENAVAWLNDPEVSEWILQGDFPLTRLAEAEYFDKAAKQDPTAANFAIETLEGVHIGFSGVFNIDWRHGTGTTGSFIGRKDFWGKRYGTDAAQVRTRYAFDVLGLRLLLADTLDGNERSLRMLQGAGYRKVGRVPRRYWKRGAYRDLIIFSLERRGWERARAKAAETDAGDVEAADKN